MLHFFLRHYFPTENTILWRVRSRTAQTADIYHARKTKKKKKKRQYVWLKASRLTSCRCIAHFGKSSLICTYFIHLCAICAFCASSARVKCETIESECHTKFARKTFETLITTCLCEREKNESLQKISISKKTRVSYLRLLILNVLDIFLRTTSEYVPSGRNQRYHRLLR